MGGRRREYPPHYVLSDTADQYWLPSFRSASSRFHSVIRRHQFASVRQADSRLTRLNLELALTPLQLALTPPASGSRAALRPSPAGSGAVAVERFTYILIFPGSLLCHIIKGKQLQKSLNLTAKRLCQPPWWAEKNYINRGSYQQQHGGSTPDPLSSRTLLSKHKYYPQKCSLLFWRSGCTPRFLDQFSRFVGLALVTNTCTCLLYTSPSPRDGLLSRMPSSA